MKIRASWLLAAILAAAVGAAPAAANLSIQQDAFLRGFNSFAQANGKPARMTLKFTDVSGRGFFQSSKIAKFVFDLNGCLTVTGLSKDNSQVIDTLFVMAGSCTPPDKVDDFVLLAKYLASLPASAPVAAKRTAEDAIVQTFKAVDKTHKKQTITVGDVKLDIEFSDVVGWVMRAQ